MNKKRIVLLWLFVLSFLSASLYPFHSSYGHATIERVKKLEGQVEYLKKEQVEFYHSLKEKKSLGLKEKITESINIGGLLEVEASADQNKKDGDSSDIVLATLGLGLDAQINKSVSGNILLLWEEDSTQPVDLDVGTMIINFTTNFSLAAGKTYVPFGVFNSHFISDPMTLELGETNESTLLLGYETDLFNISAGVFNGSVNKKGKDNQISDIVAGITMVPFNGITLGGSFISDLGETDADITGLSEVSEPTAGISAFLNISIGSATFYSEYLSALNDFQTADLDDNGDGKGDKPLAYNVELGYTLKDVMEISLKFEGSKDFFSFPETQYGAAFSYSLYDNTTANIEYLHGVYENSQKRDLVTAQLAVIF